MKETMRKLNKQRNTTGSILTREWNSWDGNPYDRLAAEIVILAVDDWRHLVKRRAWEDGRKSKPNCNFAELRRFFKSGWCALLCTKFQISPERILEVLEKELAEAKKQE